MRRIGITFATFILLSTSNTILANPEQRTICGSPDPILSVADVDGSGIVDEKDLILLKNAIKKEIYYAFYDLNTDGQVNDDDLHKAKLDLTLTSTTTEQKLAQLFHQVKQFQLIDSKEELRATAFGQFTGPLAGHGVHWVNEAGIYSSLGITPINFKQAEGINLTDAGDAVKGMFWTGAAIPVFENGATDYPTPGGEWMSSRVIAFANPPPQFSDSPHEHWHTHAALCITSQLDDQGIERFILNQHTTFAECQTFPSIIKSAFHEGNIWVNLWMLHVWMFDLNPNGLFANTHPCVDPDAPSEDIINGGRPVPPFFDHGGH